MRLPWDSLKDIDDKFLYGKDFVIWGCLSFEERCCAVPEQLSRPGCIGIELLEIKDPPDAFPDNSYSVSLKVEQNRQRLASNGIQFYSPVSQLLTTEDELLDILLRFKNKYQSVSTVVLDITSLPKRYFCFLLKRLLLFDVFQNVIVTYTEAGPQGYSLEHLAEDPMTCDHLPGYAAPLPPKGSTLVVAVGFEAFSLKPLFEIYSGGKKDTKVIIAFPPNGGSTKRQWSTLRQMVTDTQEVRGNLEVIASWDSEFVYKKLETWWQDSDGLTLAPYGPKAHTLGMALFAINYDAGLYYSQPKSYNPDYSKGQGNIWAYVVKWARNPCFKRYSLHP